MHLLNSFCKVDYGVIHCPLTEVEKHAHSIMWLGYVELSAGTLNTKCRKISLLLPQNKIVPTMSCRKVNTTCTNMQTVYDTSIVFSSNGWSSNLDSSILGITHNNCKLCLNPKLFWSKRSHQVFIGPFLQLKKSISEGF